MIACRKLFCAVWVGCGLATTVAAAEPEELLKVRISWGHQSSVRSSFYVRLDPHEIAMRNVAEVGFEAGDRYADGAWSTQAGAGDVDGIEFDLSCARRPVTTITNLHRIWSDLLKQSDADTVRRLQEDPAYRLDPRTLTVQMNAAGTKGFTLTVDQLQRQKAFWVPALDVYLAVGDPATPFSEHQRELASWKGSRVLESVATQPEASYEAFTNLWQDMGSPDYHNPAQTGPGHIVGLTWDSALYKFGIDRGAGVWNDFGNSDRFRLWCPFADVNQGWSVAWRGQRLEQGLPVVTTRFEKDGLSYHIEQFAYPLHGPPAERRGDIPMVLLQRVTLRNLTDHAVSKSVPWRYRRLLSSAAELKFERADSGYVLENSADRSVLLGISSVDGRVDAGPFRQEPGSKSEGPKAVWNSTELTVSLDLPAGGENQFTLLLPAPAVPPGERPSLLAMDYEGARRRTLQFWSDYNARGAQFRVADGAVNDLFRANLWHALRLPRRHGGAGSGVPMDLPYSNFAYDQKGTPWPVNQAVYVDYMIYGLRGYNAIAAEELDTIYRNNQESNGHVGGFANWGVYTPGMIYAVAQNYLLSGDRARFEWLLPRTLDALDWCLAEIRKANQNGGAVRGLVRAPLNDLTGEGCWAFNQAYLYAGIDKLGRALADVNHPRAQECVQAAASFREAIARGFGAASMRSPLVPLRDHTWVPYVPCEVSAPHRLLQQWYPTDVDTGAVHLSRLGALDPKGLLTDCLLNDHEDNLFLHGWGMANEPVYNQQATAYLLRDNPQAAIRAFYSMMACAFSQSVFEPVEHRWTWGQYFGPPSTDGAWFELYRNMLVQEGDEDTLLLLQATPRKWLAEGGKIQIERAPTYYGTLSLTAECQDGARRVRAEIEMPERRQPKTLLLRLRHPQSKSIQSSAVNGQSWSDFDVQKEWIRIDRPQQRHYSIVAEYGQ